MKRIILLITIIFSITAARAQFGVGGGSSLIIGRISGTVIDSVTNKPLDYGTVSLFRSTGKSPITGVLTDDKGNFKLDNIHPGVYRLEITFIGYPTKIINNVETTPSKPDKNLGTVVVAPSSKSLKEVTITGTAPLIENRIDKIVYNAEKDLTAAGGNATDVLQKVPLVAVDINGNVSLRGDGNVRVLINGKPSGATSASLSDVLKTIPADQIKSIEVITSPSAKYDAEGTAGIINIITKQKNMSGFSGSVSGGIGTRQNNGNINLNYSKNRFSLAVNAGGNLTWPQVSNSAFTQTFLNGNTPTLTNSRVGSTKVKRHGAIGSITASYDFNSFNSLTSTVRLNQGGFNSTGGVAVSNTDFINPANNRMTTGSSVSHNTFGGFDWSLDYTHKFKKEGHELSFSSQWSHSVITTDFMNTYAQQSAFNPNQRGDNNGTNNEYTLQTDYVLPINKIFKLEAGGKGIFRNINSNADVFKTATFGAADSTSFILDPTNSYLYKYNQYVTAGYAVMTITLPKKYTLLAGVRDENTSINGEPSVVTTNFSPFSNSYNTFVPSFTVQKALSATKTIKLTYSKRITRPSLTFLNPFLNASNPNSQSQGNPKLSPEVSQTVELNYNTFIKSSVINFSVYYKHTGGLIESIALPINNNQGTLTTYANVGVNNSFGGSFFGSINPISILTIRGSINGYTYNPTAEGGYATQQTRTGATFAYNAFLSGSVNLPSGFIAEVFAVENSKRYTIQGSNPSFSIFGAGVRKQFMQKKMSLGINTLEPFNKYKHFNSDLKSPAFVQNSTFAFPFRSVGLTFSYNFGKITFSNPMEKKKGVNNDDLKQGDQGGVGGGSGGGGGR
ncbi:outer membrane beta-barrel family protein [Mucilaginibacter sp.]|uniref:outer membrane beta-barrel family protein n=1 Tax=Mucilaginibacter sp. TaxID=1882438 RepID=UPI002619B9CC|nr:outer membrane beta-barrel family protein [Mucilaginibacter sp.]MDB4926929.1 TonB-dependent receptor [Mucilaginibacter sp.]